MLCPLCQHRDTNTQLPAYMFTRANINIVNTSAGNSGRDLLALSRFNNHTLLVSKCVARDSVARKEEYPHAGKFPLVYWTLIQACGSTNANIPAVPHGRINDRYGTYSVVSITNLELN